MSAGHSSHANRQILPHIPRRSAGVPPASGGHPARRHLSVGSRQAGERAASPAAGGTPALQARSPNLIPRGWNEHRRFVVQEGRAASFLAKLLESKVIE